MSAFEVSDLHISHLVRAAHDWAANGGIYYGGTPVHRLGKNELGRKLLDENIASVSYRYDEQPRDTSDYRHQFVPAPDPVTVLSALACYEYQASEHPGWKESDARRFCDHLRSAATRNLPGYSDAPWEITSLDQLPA